MTKIIDAGLRRPWAWRMSTVELWVELSRLSISYQNKSGLSNNLVNSRQENAIEARRP